ncbi:MAG: DNA repair ATPase, partial [Myxococcaceae bacterium]
MAETAGDVGGAEGQSDSALEGGSYEVIRARLLEQARTLGAKADELNERRKKLFSGAELGILGNERVRTENNCVPRDMVSLGRSLLFGYNVFIGLKSETHVSDVLSLHRFEKTAEGFDLSTVPASEAGGFLEDPRFVKDFQELYRYYKGTRLVQVRRPEGRLLLVFQIGDDRRDLKVFRFAVDHDGRVSYIDNRGERENVYPASHDFEWTPTSRDHVVNGKHPHVNILDQVFVECVGGDLTVKVENNTEDGRGIYSEPVEDANQSIDDGQILYAKVGTLILLKILPFRETTWRYLVFNTRTEHVVRIDAIGDACVQLPEDQGIIFPGGFYLQTGDFKVFDGDSQGLQFKRARRSPNGEDVLYVFHDRADGRYVLLPYNLVRREVANPIVCHGYSLFDDGRMVIFRSASNDPARVHPVQIWQTPFLSAENAAASAPDDGSFLSKVGNADLVRGISEAFTLKRMCEAEQPTRRSYEDLIAAATRMADAFYWLSHGEIGLLPIVEEVRRTADLIVAEFEKVQALKRRAVEVIREAEEAQQRIVAGLNPESLTSVDLFMEALRALRNQRGHLITLKEVRYVDLVRIAALERETAQHFDRVSEACVQFLLGAEALKPLTTQLEQLLAKAQKVERSTEVQPLSAELEKTAEGLNVLSEVVAGLQVGDPVARAKILEGISEVFSQLNRVRASITVRRKDIFGREGRAEFAAQFKLFGQTVESALGLSDTPEKCDEQLSRLTVQLEELEGRFGEFDEFLGDLAKKREELYEAFGAKRQTLLDERQRRAANLFGAAERILQGVARRADSFKSDDELNAYFASDAMVQKARQVAEQLLALGDSVRADELQSKLKAAKQEASRALRDKKDLFEDGQSVIKLGVHRFNVNTQPLELTVVPRDEGLALHVTGTDFYERVEDASVAETRGYWSQHLVSETDEVYRAEYLAASLLFDAEEGRAGLSLQQLRDAHLAGAEAMLARVRGYAQDRYDEGYERGVHDHDAAKILQSLVGLRDAAGLLRFPPRVRAQASLFWACLADPAAKALWHRRAVSYGRLRELLQQASALSKLAEELAGPLAEFLSRAKIEHTPEEAQLASRYLVEEIRQERPRFTTAQASEALVEAFKSHLDQAGTRRQFEDDLRHLSERLPERIQLVHQWVDGFVEAVATGGAPAATRDVLWESVAILLTERAVDREVSSAKTRVEVEGLLGTHARISGQKLAIVLDAFNERLWRFVQVRVPGYRAYRRGLRELLERERKRLRLDELSPKILSSFVRNRLIGEVYLPLIGQNLAKQIGAAGETKRTDRMGLLLVVSPPGYGKTTLMEYVAARLGLAFVKVNGPALGHEVTSLDPADAPNAAARQEVERINLAFEMGNNVMLYLDDIQHTSPELLQKFISLCDGQRKIEGVWKDRSRTYDLRGKKFCVVMAGNPYTETGERFRIPDMLANRADTYNLGEILNGKDDLFALSFIENALTANSVLAPMSSRDPGDVHKLIRMARGEDVPTTDLGHAYSAVELQEITGVLHRLLQVQRVLLKVNQAYIASASQDDQFRTEPAFKLQGSYRNMAKVADKIVAAMTPDEVERVIDDHYAGESQTLTTGAEHNLLKLAELRGRMTPEQKARWEEIKRGYVRIQLMGGRDDDPVARVTGGIASLGAEIGTIRDALTKAAAAAAESARAQAERTA